MEQLVDTVTRLILERLNAGNPPRVVTFGEVPPTLLCGDAQVRQGQRGADPGDFDYIVMTAESFRAIHGGQSPGAAQPEQTAAPEPAPAPCKPEARSIDLTGKRLIHERDLRDHNTQGGDVVRVARNAIITALAHDYAKGIGAKISKE